MYMNLHSIHKLNGLLRLMRASTWLLVATKGNPTNEEPRRNRTRTTTNAGRDWTKKL